MVVSPPGPLARQLSADLSRYEAPGINTLYRGEPNIVWAEALGSNVLDVDGNRYIDLTSGFGVAAIGHRHPAVVEAIVAQSQNLLHGLGDACGHPWRIALAKKLAPLAPKSPGAVYFAVSGADAVEIAIKTALLARPGRTQLVTFDPAYHGLTLGALNASSRPWFRTPFQAHLHDQIAVFKFGQDLRPLGQYLDQRTTAAVLVEPVVGREGVHFPPAGWLAELGAFCSQSDTLLIFDEIFTGFGRCGTLFAYQQENVLPDLLCVGKALGGGLPIAAVLGQHELLQCWSTPGEALHTGTFVANPLACCAALATLEVLDKGGLVQRVRELESLVANRLAQWPTRFSLVQQCRGRGLLWGIELAKASDAARLVDLARSRGLLLLAGGSDGRVVQLVPALTIGLHQLEHSLSLLEDSFGILAA